MGSSVDDALRLSIVRKQVGIIQGPRGCKVPKAALPTGRELSLHPFLDGKEHQNLISKPEG